MAATIRIDIATLPGPFGCGRPDVVAGAIEAALRQDGITVDCSDLCLHIKIDLPTVLLAAASVVLAGLKLI